MTISAWRRLIATPSPFLPRTPGKSPPAWCSTMASATSCIHPFRSARNALRALRFLPSVARSPNRSSSIPSRAIASIGMAWGRGCNWIGWPASRFMCAPPAASPPFHRIFFRTIHSPARTHLPWTLAVLPRPRRPFLTVSRSLPMSCRRPTRPAASTFLHGARRPFPPTRSWT